MNPNLNSCRCRHKCFESNYWISWISWSFNIESSLGNNIKHVNHEKRNRLYIQIIFFSHTHTYTEKILGLLNSRPPEEPKISTGKKTDIFFYFTNNNNNKKISNKFQSIQRQQKSWSKKKKRNKIPTNEFDIENIYMMTHIDNDEMIGCGLWPTKMNEKKNSDIHLILFFGFNLLFYHMKQVDKEKKGDIIFFFLVKMKWRQSIFLFNENY